MIGLEFEPQHKKLTLTTKPPLVIRLIIVCANGCFNMLGCSQSRYTTIFDLSALKKQCLISFLFISLLAILFSGCRDNSSETPAGTTTQFIFISDIHFSPFYDETIFNDLVKAGADQWAGIFEGSTITEPQSWGNETNYPLLTEALDAARKQLDSMPFLLFGGDILAHKFREIFFGLYGKED